MKIKSLLSAVLLALACIMPAQAQESCLAGKTIVAFGDSYVRNHRRPYAEAWHAKVADQLGMNYVNMGRNGSSIAFDRTKDGFGPAMTQRALEIPDSADIILIIAGHNDADYVGGGRGTFEAFEAGLDSLCAGLRAAHPQACIGWVTPWDVDRPYFKEVNEQIHKTCDKYGIPVLDMPSTGIIKVNDPEFRQKYFQGPKDTAHLTAEGHDLLIDTGKKFIESLCK